MSIAKVDRKIASLVNEHGLALQHVLPGESDAEPAFTYTIGLYQNYRHPEICLVGFRPELSHTLLNLLGEAIKNGSTFREGPPYAEVIQNYPVYFLTLNTSQVKSTLVRAWVFYEGDTPPALQLFLPDKNGKFPWDEGVDPAIKRLQCRLFWEQGVRKPRMDA